jgi:hypothetical protein
VEQPEVIIIQQESDEDEESEEAISSEQETDIDYIRIKNLEIGSAAFLLQNKKTSRWILYFP